MGLMMNVSPPKVPLWRVMRERRTPADEILRVMEVAHPPVRVDEIVRRMGITLEPRFAPEYSGKVEVDGDTAIICYRTTEAPVRQRFTIAHELGHLMLHSSPEEFRFSDQTFNGTPKEVAANKFAADLLMPLWMLEGYVAKFGPDVEKLARIFEVSSQAMDIRLGTLSGYYG